MQKEDFLPTTSQLFNAMYTWKNCDAVSILRKKMRENVIGMKK